jgi:hypothetical protein
VRVRALVGVGGVAAVLTLLFLLYQAFPLFQPEAHRDGEGPLASAGDWHHQDTIAFDPVKGGPWTMGYRLCLAQGTQPAVIDSVGPAATVGSGFRFLGAYTRQFTYTREHTPIGSVDGYPPSLPDTLHPVTGFSVSIPCQRATWGSIYTELLIGFGRGTGTDGGGWRGIKVGYTVGGRHRIVTLGYNMLICGSSFTDFPHICG